MNKLEQVKSNPRVIVRRDGDLNREGNCVVFWMQRKFDVKAYIKRMRAL